MGFDRPSGGSDRPREGDRPQETGSLFGSPQSSDWRPPRTAAETEIERKKGRGELRYHHGEGRYVESEPYDHVKFDDRIGKMKDVKLPDAIREFPRAQDAIDIVQWNWSEIDCKKFNEYSMNPEHPQNRGKAKGWEEIGYNVRDKEDRLDAAWDMVAVSRRILPDGHVTEIKDTPYGMKFHAVNGIIGPNGKPATYDSCWMVEQRADGQKFARMITSWVRPHKETPEDRDDRA